VDDGGGEDGVSGEVSWDLFMTELGKLLVGLGADGLFSAGYFGGVECGAFRLVVFGEPLAAVRSFSFAPAGLVRRI
jgi:hypothetical protein